MFKPRLADLDPIAQDSIRLAPVRIGAALILVLASGPALGWFPTLAWGAVVLAMEALDWPLSHRFSQGRAPSRADRLWYLAVSMGGNLAWLSFGLLYWWHKPMGSAFIAALMWSALLLNAVGYAFRSATALWVFAAPTVATVILAPMIWPRSTGPELTMSFVGALLCCGFALMAGWSNIQAARELARSQAEVEAERARAEQANAAKSAFLAFMSHEIRTPLNGVLGMVQAMGRDELTPSQRERLGVVASSGETLLLLLNDLLDLSRIEAGRLDLEDGVVDLAAAAETARLAFAPLAAEKGIDLRLQAPPETQGWWAGDPARIQQIIANLVANAVKFTERGEVVIALSREPDGLAVTVSDTGSGIAPGRLATLFDRFVQADAATSRQYGGSGLGLAICRQLAELMGGSIGAESRLGEGSRFTVHLPMAPAAAPPQAKPAAPAAPQPGGLRLLVAEDNATNRLVLSTLLGQVGLDAHMVENGQEAVAACADAAWDLVLMDVQMPVMDGVSAVRAIRAREAAEGRPRMPVIALTANAMAHHRAEYLAAGMDAMVAKPIQLTQLLTAMDEALNGEEARKSA
jgi:signal transduction histidine kinase/ActR/RegA family two-component response regulator